MQSISTTKYLTTTPAGLIQPIEPPTQVWEDISMDFVVSMLPSLGNTAKMVLADRFSRATHPSCYVTTQKQTPFLLTR